MQQSLLEACEEQYIKRTEAIDELKTVVRKRTGKKSTTKRCVYVSIHALTNWFDNNVKRGYTYTCADANQSIKLALKIGYTKRIALDRISEQLNSNNVVYAKPIMLFELKSGTHPIDLEEVMHTRLKPLRLKIKVLSNSGSDIWMPKELYPITYEVFQAIDTFIPIVGQVAGHSLVTRYCIGSNLHISKILTDEQKLFLRSIDPEIIAITNVDGTGTNI